MKKGHTLIIEKVISNKTIYSAYGLVVEGQAKLIRLTEFMNCIFQQKQ
jgi:hypothetical protein